MHPARLVIPTFFIAITLTPAIARAQTPSFSRTDLETGLHLTERVIAADFNRDGKADLLVTSHSLEQNYGIYLLLGHGDATFDAPVLVLAPPFGTSLGAADVSGDGIIDLVFVTGDNVWTLTGAGDGTFGPPLLSPRALSNRPPLLVDVNHDAKLDLILADQDDGILVSLGNGDGTFGMPARLRLGGAVPRVAAGDVNGDGNVDLVAANIGQPDAFDGSIVSVLFGDGTGTFRAGDGVPVARTPGSIIALDANGDGELDVAASSYATATLSVAAGRGDGSFLPAASYPIPGPGTADTATADFNVDGSPDLAVCGSANLLSIFTNTGGAFGQRSDYPSASSCTSMAVADFDGDGRPDLALNHFAGSGTLSIFRNTTMPPDAQPPAISIAASPRMLWPAHGGTIAVTLSGTITDEGSGVDASSLAFSVEDEYGLVEPAGRLTADTAGRYSFSVPLTASRRGDDTDGRTYRIVVTAADRAGNRTSAAAIVMVPHDRGR